MSSITYKRFLQILALVLLVVTLPVVWMQRWNIHDSWRLRNYTPPAEIERLATGTTMHDDTRRLFYVYHPTLDDKQAFNDHCRSSEQTIVLGCYVSGTGIYLFNVTDERLAGIKEVTAAHEVLHVAYERLSGSEKERIDKLLNDAYDKLNNQRINDTIEEYRQKGADITNELHSILGTEVRDLPQELEQYYARYFANRLVILEFSEKYEQAFTERKEKIDAIDKQVDTLKRQIDAGEVDLKAREQDLQTERVRLDNLLAGSNNEAYNAAVPGFNARVNAYNAVVGNIRGFIDEYNRLVAERNALAVEENELVKAIDSRPSTIEGQ